MLTNCPAITFYHFLKVELELAGRKLKRALNYANKENIPYVLIIGEEELSTETVMLRNMKEGSEVKVPFFFK